MYMYVLVCTCTCNFILLTALNLLFSVCVQAYFMHPKAYTFLYSSTCTCTYPKAMHYMYIGMQMYIGRFTIIRYVVITHHQGTPTFCYIAEEFGQQSTHDVDRHKEWGV